MKQKLINLLILICIVLGVVYLLRFDIYEHDDYLQSFFYSRNWWDIIKTADHGRYFSWIYMKLIVHGSSILFNVHPNDNLLIKIVVGIDIVLIVWAMSLLFTKPFNQKITPVWLLITVCTIFFFLSKSFPLISRYNQHFAYLSNFLFFPITWGIVAGYFIQGKVPQSKDLLRNSLLALFFGTTAHFNILSTIGTLVFLFLYAPVSFYLKVKRYKKHLSPPPPLFFLSFFL